MFHLYYKNIIINVHVARAVDVAAAMVDAVEASDVEAVMVIF
jgi:hypothetical protein